MLNLHTSNNRDLGTFFDKIFLYIVPEDYSEDTFELPIQSLPIDISINPCIVIESEYVHKALNLSYAIGCGPRYVKLPTLNQKPDCSAKIRQATFTNTSTFLETAHKWLSVDPERDSIVVFTNDETLGG